MQNITITYTSPVVMINGNRYEVKRTDAQIVQDMMEIDASLLQADSTQSKLFEKEKALSAYLDTLFGNGASKQIVESIEGMPTGQTLGLSPSIFLCEKLISDANKRYKEAFTLTYGEEC